MYIQLYAIKFTYTLFMSRQAIKKNELIILIISLLAFAILITFTAFYYRSNEKGEKQEKEEPVVVEGAIAPRDQAEPEKPRKESETIGSKAFFLTPSAAEVLTAIRNADPYAEPPDPTEIPPMKVMWPGYYFPDQEAVETADEIIIQLDVDESGFGVILICTISLADYPEIKILEPGQRIWVAGEVTQIDMEGTGTVSISVEYIRFDEGPAAAQKPSPLQNK